MMITLTAFVNSPPTLWVNRDKIKIDLGNLILDMDVERFSYLIQSLVRQGKQQGIEFALLGKTKGE